MRGAAKLRRKILWACFASQSSIKKVAEIQPDFFSSPSSRMVPRGLRRTKWQSTTWLPFWLFLGWTPKKSPWFSAPLRPLPSTGTPHPWPLGRKGRGEKDLEESAGKLDSIRRPLALCCHPTFFGWTPKKSPFLAPQKSQKSRPRTVREFENST